MRVELDGYYLVGGPSRLAVVRGEARVIGYRVIEGDHLVVPAGRRFPAVLSGVFDVLPEPGRVSALDPRSYELMENAARAISRFKRPVLLGPTDSGKSTLAAWILNVKGGGFLLTMDVGQNELHCPGFSSLAAASPPVLPGGSFRLVSSCFIGSFSPRGVERVYLSCASTLSRMAGGDLVVDSDGWVSLPDGVTLKAGLAGVVDADAIVSVGLSGDALELLRSLVRAKILELPRLVAKTKSREDRVMHRERLIAKNLEGAKTRAFKVSTVKFHGLPVFKGRELPKSELSKLDPRAIYGERQGEMLVLVSKRPQARAADVTYLKPGWERGLIASVMDKSGASALGLIEKIDYSRKLVHVYTGFKGLPDCIIVGRERIDPSPFKGRVSW